MIPQLPYDRHAPHVIWKEIDIQTPHGIRKQSMFLDRRFKWTPRLSHAMTGSYDVLLSARQAHGIKEGTEVKRADVLKLQLVR